MGRLLLPLVVGCVACGGMSAAARGVRIYGNKAQLGQCEDRGIVNGRATGWGARFRVNAENAAREDATRVGADSLVVLSHESTFFGHEIVAEAYKCQGLTARPAITTRPMPAKPLPLPALSKPTRLVVLDFRMLGVDARIGTIFTGLVAAELQKVKNLSVIDRADIDAAIDVERQKDLIGCDNTTCLAEIAGALGTNLVVYGSLGSIGTQFAVNASLYDSKNNRARARFSRMVVSKEDELIAIVPELSAELALGLGDEK
jgi:hypothetical protein